MIQKEQYLPQAIYEQTVRVGLNYLTIGNNNVLRIPQWTIYNNMAIVNCMSIKIHDSIEYSFFLNREMKLCPLKSKPNVKIVWNTSNGNRVADC